jgi:hypothetical protein
MVCRVVFSIRGMFDLLIQFLRRQSLPLLKIYLQERKNHMESENKKNEEKQETKQETEIENHDDDKKQQVIQENASDRGVMMIIQEKRNADVRFYENVDVLPCEEEIKKEMREFQALFLKKDAKNKMDNAWIIDMPPIPLENLQVKDTYQFPIWYLVLNDSHVQIPFVGMPEISQEDTEEKKKYVNYVFVTHPSHLKKEDHGWEKESQTVGQKYLRTCFEASENQLNYAVFRSIYDFDIIINGHSRHHKKKQEVDLSDRTDLTICMDRYHLTDFFDMVEIDRIEKIGTPIAQKYGDHYVSLEIIRHMITAISVKEHFPEMISSGKWNLCEIGGSYGSFCYILSLLTKWNHYTFLEISYCAHLAKKVLQDVKVKDVSFPEIKTFTDNDCGEIDLLISQYTLEELTDDGLLRYSSLFQKCRNIFIVIDDSVNEKLKKKLICHFGSTLDTASIKTKQITELQTYLIIIKKDKI